MPPLTYIHASEAARTTAGGRGVGGGKPTEQRAQSDACIGFVESRRRKTALELCSLATEGTQEGQITPPLHPVSGLESMISVRWAPETFGAFLSRLQPQAGCTIFVPLLAPPEGRRSRDAPSVCVFV